ncbi:hypothetical protein DMO17_11075 [Aquipseudomonas alcaligenes]|uniref:Uncharacterized protein n=1 Tax=Aquipseudomonas alcaligenes TaxID=43263 RepID=A0A2V4KRX2_AQUAC|nr:hypothetical protein [Pseudomonas alcaligenes]PYC24601.1 hypothetical protein DMO17_11075 [Pseudomonas alcaligenes]
MHSYQHNVSGFYLRRGLAESTLAQLLHRGLRSEQLQIIAANSNGPPAPSTGSSRRAALNNLLIYGICGAAVGTAIGVLVEAVMLLGDVSPAHITPAMLIGWTALGGGLFGGTVAAAVLWNPSQPSEGEDVLLVAQTHNARETAIAREVMKASADLCKDTDMRARLGE